MSGFETAGGVLALVELSAKVASVCVQYSQEVKQAKNDIVRLRTQVNDLESAARSVLKLLDGPHGESLKNSQSLRRAIHDGLFELGHLYDSLRPKSARQALNRLGFRSLRWPLQTKDVERVKQSLRQCTQTISLALQIDQTAILLNIDQRMVLDRLPVAEGASFDSSAQEHNRTCLPNTRVELLQQIAEWAKSSKSESIFWLSGMAGTGKSTISRTIAQQFAEEGILGASFFFKRGEADRGGLAKFFATIIADLIVRHPATAPHVKAVLEHDPSTATKNAREQFDKLFLQPLLETETDDTLVFVVDALDECDREDDIKLLIHLFSGIQTTSAKRVKVFLTSRPELPPRVGFLTIDGWYQDAFLHAVPEPVIERDICYFLEYELAKIREEYNVSVAGNRQFSSDWPSSSDIQSLVKMAVPLFIFAATVCRFIADRKYGNPGKQLTKVLNYQYKSHSAALNETYKLVLSRQLAGLNEEEKNEVVQEFCNIVGPIVVLETPLSVSALAQILDISDNTIDDRLDLLHSVLSVPESTDIPVRLLHRSFRDFLLEPTNRSSNDFWIDGKQIHNDMASNCLRVLKCLRQNMCSVKFLSTPRSDINVVDIDDCLPPEVQYACLYWVYHMEKADMYVSDDSEIYKFLQRDFLHWIESLSLIGRAYECRGLIDTLRSRLQADNSTNSSQFLDDAWLFLGTFISAIDATPLQLYSSMLIFAPQQSIVRNNFMDKVKGLSLLPIVEDDWGQCIQKLEGHHAWLQSVAFSHDSTLVASASGDTTVRIWLASTGECVQVFEEHHGEVNSVVFSHDSKLVASCDTLVRIWRTHTGECELVLEGHGSFISSLAFTHDSSFLASGSSDKSIRIWSTETGKCVHKLEGHQDVVSSVAFSPSSKLLVSASHDKTIRIWRADTGECLWTLEGHIDRVNSVTFSHDSSLLASASDDRTVRVWDAAAGKHLHTLEDQTEEITSVSFSGNSKLLVSASMDGGLRIWQAETGVLQTLLAGRSYPAKSVTFSHDSKQIATAAYDKTVRIWRADLSDKTNVRTPTFEGHTNSINAMALSEDKQLVVTRSADNTMRVWCMATGGCLHKLEGHTDFIRDIIFSSDSKSIFSSSFDGTYRVWSASSGKCIQTIEMEPYETQLKANALDETARHLSTDVGSIALDVSDLGGSFQDSVGITIFSKDSPFGLSSDRCWITKHGENLLWLPVEVRPFCAVAIDSTVVMGSNSNRFTMIRFDN